MGDREKFAQEVQIVDKVNQRVAVIDASGRVLVATGSTPQTDALTDAQLRATAVPVSTGLTPLTDTQLRATPVPVSTGLTTQTDALTNTQLRAAPVITDAYARDLRIERYSAATGDQEVRYLGTAPPATAESSGGWTVKRFDHDTVGLVEIKTATGAWTARATLF